MEGSRPDRVSPDQRPRDGRSRRLGLPVGNSPRQPASRSRSSTNTGVPKLYRDAGSRLEQGRESQWRDVQALMGRRRGADLRPQHQERPRQRRACLRDVVHGTPGSNHCRRSAVAGTGRQAVFNPAALQASARSSRRGAHPPDACCSSAHSDHRSQAQPSLSRSMRRWYAQCPRRTPLG